MNLKKIIKAIVIILSMICSISAFSQEIRIDTMNNVSVKDAMAKVKKQTGYSFDFQSKDVDTKRIVSVSAQNLNDVINQILEGQKNLIYEIRDKVIVIKKREIGNKVDYVKGSVVDLQGEPIIGATVRVFGMPQQVVITDVDGNFNIKANLNAILEISCIGFKTTEASAIFDKPLTIKMKERETILDEAVVIGYGTQLKKNLSSSVTKVDKKALSNPVAPSFESMLQGRVAGVDAVTGSALGGSTVSVLIRGASSFSASSSPLYVLDGIPIDAGAIRTRNVNKLGTPIDDNILASINPNDIESLEILKDAAAAAIYGSRGANGVVLITTKRGQMGKINVSASSNWAISTATRKPNLANAQQYISLAQEAWTNSGNSLENFWEKSGILIDGLTKEQALATDTDWLDKTLRTGFDQDYNVSISGGNDKTLYFISGNFKDQNTIMRGNHYQKLSVRSNLESQISRIFRVGINMFYTAIKNHLPPMSSNGGTGHVSFMLPIWPVYKEDGSYFKVNNNPVALIKEQKIHLNSNHFIGNWFVKANILDGLTFRSNAGLHLIVNDDYRYRDGQLQGNKRAVAGTIVGRRYEWNWKNIINYSKIFDKHNIDIVLVHEMQKYKYNSNTTIGEGFFNSAMTMPTDATIQRFFNNNSESSFLSFIGRINYNYRDTYLFSASLRADASSKFAPKHKWGYFPAASIGYNISNEKYFASIKKVVNFLKLRASYGIVGNAGIGDYQYYDSYDTYSYNGQTGIKMKNIGNPRLSWEQTAQLDLGLDMELIDGRIGVTFDWYDKRTKDLLLPYPVSGLTGINSITQNIGELKNTGFELEIRSTNIYTKNFEWNMTFNIAHNYNEVTKLIEEELTIGGLLSKSSLHIGYPIGAYPCVEWGGVDPQTGEDIYIDKDGNKLLYSETKNKYGSFTQFANNNEKITGHPFPKFTGGFNNTFAYKNFSLSCFFTFAIGQDFNLGIEKRSLAAFGNQKHNVYIDIMKNRWQKPGDKALVSKLTTDNVEWPETTETLHRTDYLRLKEVNLSYRIPIKKNNFINSVNCYIKGINLLTFTKAPDLYWDPEWTASSGSVERGKFGNTAPQALSVILGVNLIF